MGGENGTKVRGIHMYVYIYICLQICRYRYRYIDTVGDKRPFECTEKNPKKGGEKGTKVRVGRVRTVRGRVRTVKGRVRTIKGRVRTV